MSDTHSLITVLSRLPDPRVERSKEHELTDLLVIAVCTLLVGGESFYDMEDFGRVKMLICGTQLTRVVRRSSSVGRRPGNGSTTAFR